MFDLFLVLPLLHNKLIPKLRDYNLNRVNW